MTAAPFTVYLYETAEGVAVMQNKLLNLSKSSIQTANAIQVGLLTLAQHGTEASNKFRRLRHVEGGATLWELRILTTPAYRILFAPVPNAAAWIILDAVKKEDMARDAQHYMNRALGFLDHWLSSVYKPPD